jgi:hypothetical protein
MEPRGRFSMAVSQITIRVTPEFKAAFGRYAGSLRLKVSELAKLLILREGKQRRLAQLKAAGNPPERGRNPRGTGKLPTITAHLSSVDEVIEFDAYAQECGLNRNGAGLLLLETELRERWLERAINSP